MGDPTLAVALEYSREAVLAGQWWRLATAHLAHAGWVHGLLNATGLLLLFGLAWRIGAGGVLLASLGLSASVISLSLLLMPWVDWYLGLSGALYAGLLVIAHRLGRGPLTAAAALLLGRVIVGALSATSHGLAEAHLIGLLMGCLIPSLAPCVLRDDRLVFPPFRR